MPWNDDGSRKDPSVYKLKGHTLPGPFQKKAPLKQRKGEHHVEADTVGSKSSDARAGSPLERKSPLKQTDSVSKKQGVIDESGAKLKWSEDTQQWTNTSTGEILSSDEVKTIMKRDEI